MGNRLGDDRGSIVPLAALALVGFVIAVGLMVTSAGRQVELAKARLAADMAALAAASAGPDQAGLGWARTIAEANGAEVVRYGTISSAGSPSSGGWTVVVEVSVGDVTVQAAALRVTNAGGS